MSGTLEKGTFHCEKVVQREGYNSEPAKDCYDGIKIKRNLDIHKILTRFENQVQVWGGGVQVP